MIKKELILCAFILLLSIQACQKNAEMQENPKQASKSLSEIQSEACSAAHDAGTCDTRLAEIGIVLKEDCCEVMGKCC